MFQSLPIASCPCAGHHWCLGAAQKLKICQGLCISQAHPSYGMCDTQRYQELFPNTSIFFIVTYTFTFKTKMVQKFLFHFGTQLAKNQIRTLECTQRLVGGKNHPPALWFPKPLSLLLLPPVTGRFAEADRVKSKHKTLAYFFGLFNKPWYVLC